MKKQYESPMIEIEEFEIEDALCTMGSGNYNLRPDVPIFQHFDIID